METLAQILGALPSLGGADAEHILAWVTAVMSVLAILGWALDATLPRLNEYAKKTETDVDDKVVSWLERVSAVLGLINAIVPRPRFGQPREEDEREARPPTDIGPGAVFFAVVVGLSVFVSGCGLSQWDVHAAAGTISNESALTGRAIIMGERRRVLLAAGTGVEDIAAAVTAAADEWDMENRVLVEAYNLFASSANQYVSSAFAALRGEADSLEELVTLAKRVADAWNAIAALLDATNVSDEVPRIPDWLLRFLNGDQTAQPTAGGEA